MAFSEHQLLKILLDLPRSPRYWVGFSGGMDSHALLHALAAVRGELGGCEVLAVHVDHGLSPHAADWSAHCERVCEALAVPCRVLKVDAKGVKGESPEAAARSARYRALTALLAPGDALLTAQHQDDQAETVLLQLLRGAGPAGLAAMPRVSPLGAGRLLRPLLDFSREELHTYAEQAGLTWIEDPSNFDTGFDRNYLRHEVMPRLRERWPAFARTLSRSAAHCAEAAQLIDSVARADLERVRGEDAGMLRLGPLQSLAPARQRAVLRAWLAGLDLPMPAAVHVQRILTEVAGADADAEPRVHWPGAEVRRYRDVLYAMPPLAAHDASRILAWEMDKPLALPGGGRLEAVAASGQGVKAALCGPGHVEVRFRQGGERCRPVGRGATHSLKHLLQERGVAPWLRERVPLLFVDGQLAAVADWWVCEPFQAEAGEPGWVLRWHGTAS